MRHKPIATPGQPSTRSEVDPLEVIARLEGRRIGTVVLAGSYASDPELAAFLAEHHPSVRVEREATGVALR